MTRSILATSAFLVLLTSTSAFAEYDVEWNRINTRNFLCGNSIEGQTSFEVEIRYDLVTTVSIPKVTKRKEIRLTVLEVTSSVSTIDLWASQILNLPMTQFVVGSDIRFGADKINSNFGSRYDVNADIKPSIGTSYKFERMYYSSPSVAAYKLANETLNRVFFDYGGTVQFKFITDHTAKFSVELSDLRASVGAEPSGSVPVQNIDMTKIKTSFSNLNCTEK